MTSIGSNAANNAHLSRLSRGIGAVKTNGHERVDVLLEPEVRTCTALYLITTANLNIEANIILNSVQYASIN